MVRTTSTGRSYHLDRADPRDGQRAPRRKRYWSTDVDLRWYTFPEPASLTVPATYCP